MKHSTDHYHIGLDIGTNSVGFAVIDDDGKLVRAKGKNIIGARLFDEGKTAENRRMFRTTRRRLKRRKWRLNLLDSIFEPEILKQDPNFFMRLKESNLVANDERRHFDGSLLFPKQGDGNFKRQYPTIYHLRRSLMNEHRQFDIREVYLAIHHIIKYRGNFLDTTPVDQFKTDNVPFDEYFNDLNVNYRELIDGFENDVVNEENINSVEKLILNSDKSNYDKQKETAKLMNEKQADRDLNKLTNDIDKEISKAILGYDTKLNVILQLPIDSKDNELMKKFKLNLGMEDIDDKLLDVLPNLSDAQQSILGIIRKLYSQITLNQIIPGGKGLSDSMVQKYDDHHEQLKKYKQMTSEMKNHKKATALKEAYGNYIDNQIQQDDFYKIVKKNLDDSDTAKLVQALIDRNYLMPKQRTSANGVIPHQLHQFELRQIIDNQKSYYPWLAELNPNDARRHLAKYKLEELVAFHIPYYVGPLITPEEQKATSGKHFAWMQMKDDAPKGPITPWNFDQKIDRVESANNFIKRMTTKDSYLIGEDVLPDESILYQKFKVLNELNMVKLNDQRLTIAQKQNVFNDLFKTQKTITAKKVENYFKTQGLPQVTITGLSDSKKFNNNLGTYIDFKKIFGDQIDDPNLQTDFEQMIEWSTVFESREIYKIKLSTVKWLTDDQINSLVAKRYRGWGRLSQKLLAGLKNKHGERIIDVLWNTNQNFMQIQSQSDFADQIDQANRKQFKLSGTEAILDDAYTSPQNKKAIRQVMKVVDDINHTLHVKEPQSISIEFTRSPDDKAQLSKERASQIRSAYGQIANEIADSDLNAELEQAAKSKKGITDKLYLYFTQLGKDMYTGKPISIDQLNQYDIDHILPQSFVKDDSLHNRVLTSKSTNNSKSDNVPNDLYGSKMKSFWNHLQAKGLITKGKLRNLTTNPDSIDKYTKKGFINRQLVETSQVIKLVANILGEEYQNSKVIEVTAKMNHQLREDFGFIKNRFVNDYHHAFDAYLTVFAGTYLYNRYPNLHSYFVYGKNQYSNSEIDLKRFNFLRDLYINDLTKLKDKEYYPVVKKYSDLLRHQANQIYNYKFMLTTHEATTKNGAMFDQTIYPAHPTKSAKKKNKLVPVKKNRPTSEYGGYSGSVDSYMAIVRIHDKKEPTYKVVGVKRRWVDQLKQVSTDDHESYNKLLHAKLAPSFVKRRKPIDFEILLGKVMYRQQIIDGQDKFTLGSSTYKYNNRQLVLSKRSLQTLDEKWINKHLKGNYNFDTELSQRYDEVYREIVEKVDKYFPLYDINKFRTKLRNGYKLFTKLPNRDQYKNVKNKVKKISSGKIENLQEILNGLHANSTTGKLKDIGFSTPLGQLQLPSGIVLNKSSIICYQSPTGLFERQIQLKDL